MLSRAACVTWSIARMCGKPRVRHSITCAAISPGLPFVPFVMLTVQCRQYAITQNDALQEKLEAVQLTGSPDDPGSHAAGSHGLPTIGSAVNLRVMENASGRDGKLLAFLTRFIDTDSKLDEMRQLLRALQLLKDEAVGVATFQAALRDIGFQLSDSEAEAVLRCESR